MIILIIYVCFFTNFLVLSFLFSISVNLQFLVIMKLAKIENDLKKALKLHKNSHKLPE